VWKKLHTAPLPLAFSAPKVPAIPFVRETQDTMFIRSSWLVCAMGNCVHVHNSAMNDTTPQEPLKASTTHITLRLRKGDTANINEIHQVACFGDVYCVIADKSPFYDCWSSEPVIMFYSDDATRTFPRTDLPDTRVFLGAYVDHGNRRIVAANFKHEKPRGKTVNIYVYTVNDDFTCSLRHTLTNDADDCAGSCFMGRLTSVHNSAFTLVYNDMANNSHTTVLTASFDDDSSVDSSVTVIQNSQFPPVLHDLEGVHRQLLPGNGEESRHHSAIHYFTRMQGDRNKRQTSWQGPRRPTHHTALCGASFCQW
jgi:hypothetical protein